MERAARPKSQSLEGMLHVLDNAGLSGSLEVWGRCDLRDFPDFPQFRAPAAGSELQTLRAMLADDPAMQVSLDKDGAIRMIESGIPSDILNVRISHISFGDLDHNGVYTPYAALGSILGSPEVVAFMKANDVEWPNLVNPLRNPGAWPAKAPHISGSLDNVTVAEALDRVLKTFGGIWFYENCPQDDKKKRVVYIRFYQLRKMGSWVFVES